METLQRMADEVGRKPCQALPMTCVADGRAHMVPGSRSDTRGMNCSPPNLLLSFECSHG